MNACPKCGGTDGWIANCRAFGWVQQSGTWEDGGDRASYDTNTDGLNWNDTKFVICESCNGKILRSLMTVPAPSKGGGEEK